MTPFRTIHEQEVHFRGDRLSLRAQAKKLKHWSRDTLATSCRPDYPNKRGGDEESRPISCSITHTPRDSETTSAIEFDKKKRQPTRT